MLDFIERGISPRKFETKRHLRTEAARGLTMKDCIGFHGTSLHAFRHLIRYGVIPGGTVNNDNEEQFAGLGELYFWKVGTIAEFPGYNPIEQAIEYAGNVAARHYFMDALGLDFTDAKCNSIAVDLACYLPPSEDEEKESIAFLIKKGFTRNHIEMVREMALNQMGVVIGLYQSVADCFLIVDCNDGDDGWKIVTRNGLSANFVRGLRALGRSEARFIKLL